MSPRFEGQPIRESTCLKPIGTARRLHRRLRRTIESGNRERGRFTVMRMRNKMKQILVALIFSLYAATAFAFTIATGPADGSYYQIAQDIKNVAGKDGIDLPVQATRGSL